MTGLVFLVPSLLAFAGRKLWRSAARLQSLSIVVISAALPPGVIFWAAQQADGITRAASVAIAPGLFALSLIAAAIGFRLADSKEAAG